MLKKNMKESFKESVKYIANSLIELSKNDSGNVIGISSSRAEMVSRGKICENICCEISNKVENTAFINIGSGEPGKTNNKLKEICKKDMPISELQEIINKEKKDRDIVIVNIPSIVYTADGVEYAKLCDRVVLLEKYMYSTYKDYEEALIRLKAHGVKIDGVIAYEN